jgi:Ni/Co efflux regulator RcnB
MKRLVSIVAGLAVVFAGAAALAKEHGHEGHGDSNKHHQDQGRHLAKGHHKFDDRDREVTRVWCVEHRERLPVGFRPDDRLSPEFEARLRVGSILDIRLRNQINPVPSSLVRLLPPPPVSQHYIAIGGHIGLVDGAHRLQDLLPLPPLP